MNRPMVYREQAPEIAPYFQGRPYWVYEMPIRGHVVRGFRATWRAAMDAVAAQRQVIASGWRP